MEEARVKPRHHSGAWSAMPGATGSGCSKFHRTGRRQLGAPIQCFRGGAHVVARRSRTKSESNDCQPSSSSMWRARQGHPEDKPMAILTGTTASDPGSQGHPPGLQDLRVRRQQHADRPGGGPHHGVGRLHANPHRNSRVRARSWRDSQWDRLLQQQAGREKHDVSVDDGAREHLSRSTAEARLPPRRRAEGGPTGAAPTDVV